MSLLQEQAQMCNKCPHKYLKKKHHKKYIFKPLSLLPGWGSGEHCLLTGRRFWVWTLCLTGLAFLFRACSVLHVPAGVSFRDFRFLPHPKGMWVRMLGKWLLILPIVVHLYSPGNLSTSFRLALAQWRGSAVWPIGHGGHVIHCPGWICLVSSLPQLPRGYLRTQLACFISLLSLLASLVLMLPP